MKTAGKVLLLLLGIVMLFNIIAFNQAHSMLYFVESGIRTDKPEDLTFGEKSLVLLSGINIPKPKNEKTPEFYSLDYETRFIKVNDEIILEGWYIPHQNPRGYILMFHGYATAKSNILPEASAFHQMGYDIFMIDFRGSGGSNLSETSIGYYEADDVAFAAKYVDENFGWKDMIFYGQSMGGVAILKATYDEKISPEAIIIEGVFDKALSTVNNRFSSMSIPSFPSSQALLFWGGVIQNFNGFSHNPIRYADKVESPILFLHGENDPRATLAQAQSVYQAVSSEKRVVVFYDTAHESLYMANSNKWKQAIKSFFENNQY